MAGGLVQGGGSGQGGISQGGGDGDWKVLACCVAGLCFVAALAGV